MLPNVSHAGINDCPPTGLLFNRQTLEAADENADEKPRPGGDSGGDPLEEAARRERDYVRRRLAEERGREPSEDEINEWLRRHTEGY